MKVKRYRVGEEGLKSVSESEEKLYKEKRY